MRYGRLGSLLQLALRLAGTREGLAIEDVQAQFQVSRRTAERMLEGVRAAFPHIDLAPSDDRKKRWRLPQNVLRGLIAADALELAELDAAARRLHAEGNPGCRASSLESLATKLRAVMHSSALLRAEPDVELLMQAEGTSIRPGPRPMVPAGVLDTLRQALLSSQRLQLVYRAENDAPEGKTLLVEPLGLLHGQRPYLVAQIAGSARPPVMLRLDRILQTNLQDESFEREFDLQAYAAQSFGSFQEAPLAVCLRFHASVATEAAAFHFHPSQTLEELADGRLLVRFVAGGALEMCHHLATWGPLVDILAPIQLREKMAAWSKSVADHHAAGLQGAS
jgi:predicted DNA-binding transcriptional regulator YafY